VSSDAAALELVVGGRAVRLTRPEKVLYPATGTTKLDVVRYYEAVAPALLPHLRGRAVTLARFPDGALAPGWFQSNCPPGKPPWIPVAEVRGGRGQTLRYCRLEEPAALAWAASTGALELHPFLARADAPDRPLALVFDLDPSPPAGLVACCEVALLARAALLDAGLVPFVKSSGGSGLHVLAPLRDGRSFAEARRFVRGAAEALAARRPELVSASLARAGREGKVLIDWRQNAAGLQTVAPYSLRAAASPRVAAPLRWAEVETALASGDASTLVHGPADVLRRLARHGDLLAGTLGAGVTPAPK
jgi:bifunctional non-homologous end joining protein LigD